MNREYHGNLMEQVHLCSLVCNLNALLLLDEKSDRSITLENLRPGACFHPKGHEAFSRELVTRPHAPVTFSREKRWPAAIKTLSAHLTPTSAEAVDSFLHTPHGVLYAQTKGQLLDAKDEHRAYSDTEIGELLAAMHSLRPDALAVELATTRRATAKLKLASIKLPCIVVHRDCLRETFGEVLAGVLRRCEERKEVQAGVGVRGQKAKKRGKREAKE